MRLLTTLILAAVWAVLVYFTHQAIGYEKATGYPTISENLLWAGVAALPLLLGAFVINSRVGIARYLRWLCAAALGAEAIFLLGPSWLKILGIVPLLGVLLLMSPEMGGGKTAAPAQPLTPDKLKRKRRNRWINAAAFAGLAALLVWGAWFRNPLPSDAQMIEHFNAHRAEFEQLVQGYRNYRGKGVVYERSTDEVKALAKRLGVYHVVEAQGASGVWYPNPYSEHTREILRSLFVREIGHRATKEEVMTTLYQEMPELFEGFAPANNLLDVEKIRSVILVESGTPQQSADKFALRYGGIYKGYYHFPQVPQIREGRTVIAACCFVDDSVRTMPGQRVFDSLDGYPPGWKRGECVLKRIDERWFIAMCRYS